MKGFPLILFFICIPLLEKENRRPKQIGKHQKKTFRFPRNPTINSWFESNIAHNSKTEWEILFNFFLTAGVTRTYPPLNLNRFLTLSILQGRVKLFKNKIITPIPSINKFLSNQDPETYKILFFKIQDINSTRKRLTKKGPFFENYLNLKLAKDFKSIFNICENITKIWNIRQNFLGHSSWPQSRLTSLLTNLNKARAEKNVKKIRLLQLRLRNFKIKVRKVISFQQKTNPVLSSIAVRLSKSANSENTIRTHPQRNRLEAFLVFSKNPLFLFAKPGPPNDKKEFDYLVQYIEGAIVALEEIQMLLANKGDIQLALKIECFLKTLPPTKNKIIKTKATLLKAFRLPALRKLIMPK